MDVAVGLVQAYLRINGYFTVTEFPIVQSIGEAAYRAATDIDVLACRFPRVSDGGVGTGERQAAVDAALSVPPDAVDMIVGEVKESKAAFNPAGLNRDVLATTLARFGCCPLRHAQELVRDLLHQGSATTHAGHRVRLVAFGARPSRSDRYESLSLTHVQSFMEVYVEEHWQALKTSPSKDQMLGWLMLREKLRRAGHLERG